MSTDNFKTMSVAEAQRELTRLHQRVSTGTGRVEITCDGPHGPCVIISKAELESLERALAILADTEGVKELCQSLAHLAAAADSIPASGTLAG